MHVKNHETFNVADTPQINAILLPMCKPGLKRVKNLKLS